MKVSEIARLIGGIVEGDGNIDIVGLGGMDSARAGELTFATGDDNLSCAERSRASCILTSKTVRPSKKCLIRVDNPKLTFIVIYNTLNVPKPREAFTHPTAVVAKSARFGNNVWIGPNVSIEDDVEIGDNSIIEANVVIKKNCRMGQFCRTYPNVTLYDEAVLGNKVILHSGVVLGADGFGYVKDKGKAYKFPQTGKVIIGDDVEIGANTTIDRGSMSNTVIGSGTKIDNQCQIAHNVKIGKNTLIAAQAAIAGSVTIGDNVILAGKVSVIDNIKIGSNAIIAAGSGVIGNVKDGEVIWGFCAKPIKEAKKQLAVVSWMTKHFDELSKLVRQKQKS